jgi:hypothetical protein
MFASRPAIKLAWLWVRPPEAESRQILPTSFASFGAVQRGVVVFLAELPAEQPIGASEPDQ